MMRPPFLRLSVPGVLAALLLAGDPATPAGRTAAAQTATAIVGATIIDGNGDPPLEDGTIVWTGNRITAVGPSGEVDVPEGATVIDGAGKFVTPGFIDSNVHLSLYGAGETIVRYFDRNAALTLEAAQMQLKHGFTTVRDSYGSLLALMEVRDAIARGDTVGPRMLVAGNIVGWARIRSASRSYANGASPSSRSSSTTTSPRVPARNSWRWSPKTFASRSTNTWTWGRTSSSSAGRATFRIRS